MCLYTRAPTGMQMPGTIVRNEGVQGSRWAQITSKGGRRHWRRGPAELSISDEWPWTDRLSPQLTRWCRIQVTLVMF